MIDTSPKIPDGSFREFEHEEHLYVQVYGFGTWNTIIKLPFNKPEIIDRVRWAITKIEEGVPPHAPWPFPTPTDPADTQPAEEPVKSEEQSYVNYERAKRVIEEQR